MKERGILITGEFSGEEIGEFLQLLRTIERRRPEKTFTAIILGDSAGHRDALRKLEELFPRLPDDNPVFSYLRYRAQETE